MFVLTLAVVILAVLVTYNHGLDRLDDNMAMQIWILRRSVKQPQFDDQVQMELLHAQSKSADNHRRIIE